MQNTPLSRLILSFDSKCAITFYLLW